MAACPSSAVAVAGIDLKTGENVWKTDRPRDINWVTPLPTKVAGKDTVLFTGGKDVTAYEPATGFEVRRTRRA